MSTPHEVAEWMLGLLEEDQYLHQDVVVTQIADKFGNDFVYINENGNLAIDREVLKEFRELTEHTVVWERGERLWRFRQDYDSPGWRHTD